MTTSLKSQLLARIALSGPLSIADYMAECLYSCPHGYYQKQDPFGSNGDFITAPEISQLFGESLGIWVALQSQYWPNSPLRLIELGPGRGTLMNDILRATKHIPGLHQRLSVELIDNSPFLRDIQAATLAAWQSELPISWHDQLDAARYDVNTTSPTPTLIVANEFFDALPIHQYLVDHHRSFQEICVGIDPNDPMRLSYVTRPVHSPIQQALQERYSAAPVGSIVEYSPYTDTVLQQINQIMSLQGGAVALIDYGYHLDPNNSTRRSSTLQALTKHRMVDPLEDPGNADLTAHVDFGHIAMSLRQSLEQVTVQTQHDFLLSMGIDTRAAILVKHHPTQQSMIESGLARLIDTSKDTAMGVLFKVATGQLNNIPR